MREWAVARRARTRQLIELGGLVAKSGLVELSSDDRATIYGAMLEAVTRLQGNDGQQVAMLWRRRGKRAFAIEHEATELSAPDG